MRAASGFHFTFLIAAWLGLGGVAAASPHDASMVLIPEGEFVMGSGAAEDEPEHTIHLSAYYIDKYEVTQQQFEAVMGGNPSGFKGPRHPVEQVTWYEARDFCKQAGKRLPTEAEWEKAARGDTTTRYHWGDAIDGEYAWYWDNSGKSTHPVGEKKPNAFGLYDMAGNVWEWVADNYSDAYYRESPKRDPQGPFDSKYRSVRGGSWRDLEQTLRATRRNYDLAAGRFDHIGFRCARSVE
ncbi:formylglycine-generating enzyme family protein [Nitrospina watsonii]|uniref:FGE-sulfatase domain-containing protein n=1 Tax=Nitrospina watsonii TaxID=1323948 RepID=A0ABN8VZJ0_9BACT|nr:formylglycine-generating enzyme family protein [Nitrospina watsonii]CAI2719194.1 FGE-sulfatase domain-containing protein [Nitrospina watsonii]